MIFVKFSELKIRKSKQYEAPESKKVTQYVYESIAYLHKVMLQEERGSSDEISIVDANWEHLVDPKGSRISSRQRSTIGKTWLRLVW